ncbi:MAG: hypothetical protein NZ483_11425, partial [Verrucomicrobiae bacterium]|nr:hypothetical protein [Verrucomicrobiae bacterium]
HMPTRQPAYRQNRPHEQFLCNLPLPAAVVKQQLAAMWRATEPIDPPSIPPERIAQHESAEWIRRF